MSVIVTAECDLDRQLADEIQQAVSRIYAEHGLEEDFRRAEQFAQLTPCTPWAECDLEPKAEEIRNKFSGWSVIAWRIIQVSQGREG